MRKAYSMLAILFIAAMTLAACGGGGGGGATTPPPVTPPTTPDWQGTLITSPSVSPVTAFRQSVVSDGTSSYYEIFPGQANAWTLDTDFSLSDGFGNQFFYAMGLIVGLSDLVNELPQSYAELTFYTPYLGAADGVKVATASTGTSIGLASLGLSSVITGTHAAFINATSDSRLRQTVDLTSLPTGTTLYLSWNHAVSLDMGAISGYDPSYQVVLRREDGTLLRQSPLYNSSSGTPGDGAVDSQSLVNVLNQYAGQKIVLSFEIRSSTSGFLSSLPPVPPFTPCRTYAIIDAVSIKDINNNEYIINGSFEDNGGSLDGWTTNTPQEVQNMTSGARTLEGLTVRRSFYTAPNKLWGRWVDVLENNTASDINRIVKYETSLGYNGAGIIYSSSTGTKSLTAWDNAGGSRDIGWVFGNASSQTFTSDDGTGTVGNDIITASFNITVPAGGRTAIVNFILMNGRATGNVAPVGDITKKAAAIDAAAADILSSFWTDTQYRRGMTQQQVDAIRNF
jgi:hypothetical protein